VTIREIIDHTTGTLFSFEILPPRKGETIDSIYATIDPLMEFKPAFIDVTYHREEVIYKPREGGLLEPRRVMRRPGTVGISAAIKYKYGVEVVPHIICGGFTREETENALIDLHFLGINNLLLLRGDNLPGDKHFRSEPDGNTYAVDLIRQVMEMNQGRFVDEDLISPSPTNFSVGVAGYPEKHIEAPNFETDIRYLREKVEAGAEYIITQMFFDNSRYFRFVEMCRKGGIDVPVIPGLKPITLRSQLSTLPKTFNIDIPDKLVNAIDKCNDNQSIKKCGIDWCIAQSAELKQQGVPVLHYYTMSKPDSMVEVVKAVFPLAD
jgi:methylenetetrahydrofolate reductase (NADPH)